MKTKPHRLLSLIFLCLAAPASGSDADTDLPPVQMFVSGFVVRELPVHLSNQNNIEYAPDGRLFAAGYDGRLHLLRDTDGDGLEDSVTTFAEQPGGDYPLGMVVRGDSLFVVFKNEVARFRDTDGDGLPDKREVALRDWDDAATLAETMFLKRRVDYAMGLAIAPDGTFFLGLGNAAYDNAYMVDKQGVSHYQSKNRRGCVLKISADGQRVEQILTGVRYLMSLQFNRHGDLFASEQEGATWLPNGNPFDELLHLQPGRHYGFPPRHPQHLPGVIDEPSVFDYAPQHQSVCGFRFNESGAGRGRFGPEWWEGDALLTGFTRGKLYRTKLVKTAAGYVAQNQLFANLQTLASDCALSPRGELVVATHTGKPDWGTGPKGSGRIFKITLVASGLPLPVLAYAAGPMETRVEFDRPLQPTQWRNLPKHSVIECGRAVSAGDRFETIRPGYKVVQMQQAEPRRTNAVLAAALSADGRTLSLQTAARVEAVNYAITLPDPSREASAAKLKNGLPQVAAIDLCHDLSGVEAEWLAKSERSTTNGWSGWLPHADLSAARELTAASAEHARLFQRLKQPGTLRLRGQLDLSLMLRAATQPGSKLDFEYPPETVTVVFTGGVPLALESRDAAKVERINQRAARLVVNAPKPDQWIPFELTLESHADAEASLDVHWFTAEDARPRALALRRVLVPWARPAGALPELRTIPEIADGDWNAGRQLYFSEQLACFKCHVMRGEGGAVGPDLSNLIHRDYASVMKDITQPSAALSPDHLAYTIELKDGESLTAVIAGDTGDELLLADPAGKTTHVAKSRIASTRPSALSLMPEGLLDRLGPAQVRDLMTFLLTERPESGSQGGGLTPLRVSSNHRYLEDASGHPFFLVGDCPQNLPLKLAVTEFDAYMADCEAKGFNWLWICIDGQNGYGPATRSPRDKQGDPMMNADWDISSLNDKYFTTIDAIVAAGARHRQYCVLTPLSECQWAQTNINKNSAAAWRRYGRFLGERSRDRPNVVWQIGNDSINIAAQHAIVEGIKESGDRHLMTVNWRPGVGEFGSAWARKHKHAETWIDLDAWYINKRIGEGGSPAYWQRMEFERPDPMPSFNTEAAYQKPDWHAATDLDIRMMNYSIALGGGCGGHVYGAGWLGDDFDYETYKNNGGRVQTIHFRNLFEQRDWPSLAPDYEHRFITAGYGTLSPTTRDYVSSAINRRTLGMAYCPMSATVTADLSRFSVSVKARWYDPTNGKFQDIVGSPFSNSGSQKFSTPGENSARDSD
ncbi:MAG: DUF4038 domain-containing protein, partial [Verrucomicrobiales bacterium]|nr:DUF4038 domain-containing protein [Verrucomicrobiales bacterium]